MEVQLYGWHWLGTMEANSNENLVLVFFFFFNLVGQIEQYTDTRLTISLGKSGPEMVPALSLTGLKDRTQQHTVSVLCGMLMTSWNLIRALRR